MHFSRNFIVTVSLLGTLTLGLALTGCGKKEAGAKGSAKPSAKPAATEEFANDEDAGLYLFEMAERKPSFKTLVSLLKATGLDQALRADGALTVFAPTDAAFAKIPKNDLKALASDPEGLKRVLLYHVADGTVAATDAIALAKKSASVTMKSGDLLPLTLKDGALIIGSAGVVKADVKARNGVIHVIDTVLAPPQAPQSLVDILVADKASKRPQFTTLLSLLQQTGLDKALTGKEPLTVFAPTNAAFAKLPKAALAALAADPEALKGILLYHVTDGRISAADAIAVAQKHGEVTMKNGGIIAPQRNGKRLIVAQATVIKTDIAASNGIIHVVDGVLIPEQEDAIFEVLGQDVEVGGDAGAHAAGG